MPQLLILLGSLFVASVNAEMPPLACSKATLKEIRVAGDVKKIEPLLLRLIECGERNPDGHATLFNLLSRFSSVLPSDAFSEALLVTTTDAEFLSLALLEPKVLFRDQIRQARVFGDSRIWKSTEEIFFRCALQNWTVPTGSLDVIEPEDLPSLEDLETRNHCIWGLSQFPNAENVRRLDRIARVQPLFLGSDAVTAIKRILASAVSTNDSEVIRRANQTLFQLLYDYAGAPKKFSVLRTNAAIALAVPGNRGAAEKMSALADIERDPAVQKLLRQGQKIVGQSGY